jgi:hypothetical protein
MIPPKFILYVDIGLNLGIKLDKIQYEVNKSYTPQNFIFLNRKSNIFLPLLQQFFLTTNITNKSTDPKQNVLLPACFITSEADLAVYT